MNQKTSNHGPVRTGLARALSKLGFCSRRHAGELIRSGRVRVNDIPRRDPEWRVSLQKDRIAVDGEPVGASARVYVMLNKPRGLVTTASDEQGRSTVYECLKDSGLPFLSPVGRLDKASEGLLLLTNDTQWAAQITDPESDLEKVYHVQIDVVANEDLIGRIVARTLSEGELLSVKRVGILRYGTKTSWLEIGLSEGKNRHIRRLLQTLNVGVLRLIRISVGALRLGELRKGGFRRLAASEVRALAGK